MENCQTKVLHNAYQGHTEHAITSVTPQSLATTNPHSDYRFAYSGRFIRMKS